MIVSTQREKLKRKKTLARKKVQPKRWNKKTFQSRKKKECNKRVYYWNSKEAEIEGIKDTLINEKILGMV